MIRLSARPTCTGMTPTEEGDRRSSCETASSGAPGKSHVSGTFRTALRSLPLNVPETPFRTGRAPPSGIIGNTATSLLRVIEQRTVPVSKLRKRTSLCRHHGREKRHGSRVRRKIRRHSKTRQQAQWIDCSVDSCVDLDEYLSAFSRHRVSILDEVEASQTGVPFSLQPPCQDACRMQHLVE